VNFTSNDWLTAKVVKIIEMEKKMSAEFLSVAYIALTLILFVCITSRELMFLGEFS